MGWEFSELKIPYNTVVEVSERKHCQYKKLTVKYLR